MSKEVDLGRVVGRDATINGRNSINIIAGKNISITEDEGNVEISFDGELDNPHFNDKNNPHEVTAEQVGAIEKPTTAGISGQYLGVTENGVEWVNINMPEISLPPNFDNLLAWPGCTRITPPKEGDTWTEEIVTTEGNILQAQRVTVKNGDGDYTETYTFYKEDGISVKDKYTVHTMKDGSTDTWKEIVNKESIVMIENDEEDDVNG